MVSCLLLRRCGWCPVLIRLRLLRSCVWFHFLGTLLLLLLLLLLRLLLLWFGWLCLVILLRLLRLLRRRLLYSCSVVYSIVRF